MKLDSNYPFEDEQLWRAGSPQIEVRCPRCGEFTPAMLQQTGATMGADARRGGKVENWITVEFSATVAHTCPGFVFVTTQGDTFSPPEAGRP